GCISCIYSRNHVRARVRPRIIEHMDANLSELFRLLSNLIRIGTIAEVKSDRARVKTGELTTAWLPWVPTRAGQASTWSQPSIGEQVLVLAPGGDLKSAVILPALYSDAVPAPSTNQHEHIVTFPDGARLAYNSETHSLAIDSPSG